MPLTTFTLFSCVGLIHARGRYGRRMPGKWMKVGIDPTMEVFGNQTKDSRRLVRERKPSDNDKNRRRRRKHSDKDKNRRKRKHSDKDKNRRKECRLAIEDDDPEDEVSIEATGRELRSEKRFLVLDERKVAIGGAGISGISAGRTLTEFDELDFIILEANQRIGGRLYPSTIGARGETYTIERGAQYCVGNDLNEIVNIGRDTEQLAGAEDDFDAAIYGPGGIYSEDNSFFTEGSECLRMDSADAETFDLAVGCVFPGSGDTLDESQAEACEAIPGFTVPMDDDDYSFRDLVFYASGWNPDLEPTVEKKGLARICECKLFFCFFAYLSIFLLSL